MLRAREALRVFSDLLIDDCIDDDDRNFGGTLAAWSSTLSRCSSRCEQGLREDVFFS